MQPDTSANEEMFLHTEIYTELFIITLLIKIYFTKYNLNKVELFDFFV